MTRSSTFPNLIRFFRSFAEEETWGDPVDKWDEGTTLPPWETSKRFHMDAMGWRLSLAAV
jgi:hypothetical protein